MKNKVETSEKIVLTDFMIYSKFAINKPK
jgi:hypothetical protein